VPVRQFFGALIVATALAFGSSAFAAESDDQWAQGEDQLF
jgi:hypothetical protein